MNDETKNVNAFDALKEEMLAVMAKSEHHSLITESIGADIAEEAVIKATTEAIHYGLSEEDSTITGAWAILLKYSTSFPNFCFLMYNLMRKEARLLEALERKTDPLEQLMRMMDERMKGE